MCNRLLSAAAFACLAAHARAAGCFTVTGDRVRAADLAAANSWFAQLDPRMEAGASPLAGITHVIKGRELAAFARAAHGQAVPDFFADICVEREAHFLTREMLQPVLDAALGSPATILEFGHYRLPDGHFEFTRAGLAPSGLWRGRVLYGDHHSAPVWAKVQMGAGVPQGKARAVERGDQVAVEVTSGAARLGFEASAETAGQVGESVLVKNPQNGHLFQAKVVEEGKVFVHR